ncbi:MAG: CoA-transferase [Desulfitobacteriaceae bacterium]
MVVETTVMAKEMAAVFIARQIRNGEYISIGTNLPVPAAGVLLAQLTHAPDAKVTVLSYFINLAGIDQFPDLGQIANPSVVRWADAVMPVEQLIYAIRQMDLCFTGGIQIDRFGNTNLIGVGSDYDHLKFRGPGSVGTSTVMANCGRFFIYTNDHSPRTLVKKCDFVSAFGWGEGGPDARERLGLPGGGPQFIITPKAIMDFEEKSKAVRLKHVLTGSSVADVIESTGFELVIPEVLEEMEPPTVEDLAILRQRVDIKGYLRNNFQGRK